MGKQLGWRIIRSLSSRKMFGFSFNDVRMEFPEKDPGYLSRVLAEMVKERMLHKIARDIYYIIPNNEDLECFVPGTYQVAKCLVRRKPYYIGYESALRIHGIVGLNPENRLNSRTGGSGPVEFVVSSSQITPVKRRIGEVEYRFIFHDSIRFFGYESKRINQIENINVSELEKTIVDIAARPQLCGGILELGNAIYQAKDRIDQEKLLLYLARNMKKSAIKRVLFLSELFALEWTEFHERMKKELCHGITLLDPSGPQQGRRVHNYGLRVNVDPIDVKTKVLKYSRNEQ